MRPSNRFARVLPVLLLGLSLLAAPFSGALADDLPGADETPAEPPAAEALAPEPSLEALGVTDAVIERPGLKWWAIDTSVITVVTWSATMAFNKNIREGVFDSSAEQWWDNISQAPEWNDGSDAVTNYVSHPMLGALWFLAYRSRDHGLIPSALGVIFQSLFLEYVTEGPYNVPSGHDMLFTPLIGIPVGFGLDTLSLYLLKKEDRPLRYLGYLFNPFHLLPSAKKHRWDVSIDPLNKSFAISGRF